MTNENIHVTYSTTAVPMLSKNTLYLFHYSFLKKIHFKFGLS